MRKRRLASAVGALVLLLSVAAVVFFVPRFGEGLAGPTGAPPASFPAFPADSSETRTVGWGGDAASGGAAASDAQVEEGAEAERPPYDSDRVLVRLVEGATSEDAEASFAEAGLAGATVAELGQRYSQVLLPEGISVDEALARLSDCPAVESAQPNYRYYLADDAGNLDAAATAVLQRQATQRTAGLVSGTALGDALGLSSQASAPNDPLFPQQWALPSVKAPEAWEIAGPAFQRNAESGSKPVTVAILDEGFASAHGDLSGNVVFTYNATNANHALAQVSGRRSHGTHVAGIAGAVTNNATGVASVTASLCTLGLVQVFDTSGSSSTALLIDALGYVTEHASDYNIRVVNMSLGAGSTTEVSSSTDDALYAAIARAREEGIVTVAASCNSGSTRDEQGALCYAPFYAWPSDFDNVVSVINLQSSSASADGVSLAEDSNYNKGAQRDKNISAPGYSILSTNSEYSSAYSGNYSLKSGTSMASPLVAGVMGLMFTVYPDLTPGAAVSKLYATAKDVTSTGTGWDAETGYGEVDAAEALSDAWPYLTGETSLMKGESAQWAVMLGSTRQEEYTWSTSDPRVATVDAATGVVTAVAAPMANTVATATVTATSTVDPSVKVSGEFVVLSNDIADDRFSVSHVEDTTYDGSPHAPAPTVRLGAKQLVEGVDYTVSYSDNLNAGVVVATVRGIGAYQGSVTRDFTIEKAPMSMANVSLSSSALPYDGTSRAPSVTVRDIGSNASNVLASGSDYALRARSVVTGSGSITVVARNGCRNFTGSVTKDFTVAPAPAAAPVATVVTSPSDEARTAVPAKASASVSAAAPVPVAPNMTQQSVYRLYNPNTGEHFYTVKPRERKALVEAEWVYEGVAWKTPVKSGTPVYRLYNKITGDHHFTTSRLERNKLRRGDWKYEGVAWYASDSGKKKVYRLYNRKATSGIHMFTASSAEKKRLVKRGWKSEGRAF